MKWTMDQQKIIDSRNCNLLVSAAAGSGKTAVLVERIIQMISDENYPIDIDELLVVTFTKAAASQMKDKIRSAVEKLMEEKPDNCHFQNQLHLLNQANILTIDSFCYKVVKEHFYALGIDPCVRVGEVGELALLKKEVMNDVIEKHYQDDLDFIAFSESFCGDKTDEKLAQLINNVYEISGSFPCPESWIEDAKNELSISSEEMFMKLDYVKHYCDEVRNVVVQIKKRVLEMLEAARGIDGPKYMEKALLSDVALVDDLISAKNYTMYHEISKRRFANIGRGKDGTYDKDIADVIRKCRDGYKEDIKKLLKAFVLPIDKVLFQMNEQSKMLEALLNVTQEFREAYLSKKLEKNILEFSDVEHFALDILCDGYNENGQPIPSRIGKEMSDRFYEVMIDEYQDSNFLQEAILNCVSRVSKGQENIFMVGDVKQSIYSFRMARPDLFMEKYHTYEESTIASNRKLLLKNNFRSRENVLQGINYIFDQIMGSDLGGIDYTEEEALVPSRDFPVYDKDEIELLIGEGKNFDEPVHDKDKTEEGVLLAKKQENLDDNLEDIGKKELEATIIANRIDGLMGKRGAAIHQVMDDNTGAMRDVTYKDIVILLRAPSGYSDIFYEILMNHGIPVRIQNEIGYLDTVEIHQILSLLRTLDNPYNEIELVASLRGYFGRFTDQDLAELTVIKKHLEQQKQEQLYLFEVLKQLAQKNQTDICREIPSIRSDGDRLYMKCGSFLALLGELREKNHYMSISQLVQWIYYHRNYYYYVQAMPKGKERIRNMDLFMAEILHYEQSACHGLFEFLQYIDEIIANKISLGGDPSLDCDDDVVRIMSIHKSKGLEFPVVFVAGMGKQFNLKDTKEALIVHSDYHLGARYVNPNKRCGNDSFARQSFAALMRTESIAEELRIFYVALTRAKEKLIMSGVVSDIPKLIHRFEPIGKIKNIKIGFSNVHNTNSYMEFVVAALIRNKSFYNSMKLVQPRFDLKKEETVTANYECNYFMERPSFDLKVSVFDYQKIAIDHLKINTEEDMIRNIRVKEWENLYDEREKDYEKNLSFSYKNEMLTTQKAKLSVTEMKRIYEIREAGDTNHKIENKDGFDKIPIPEFMMKKPVLTSAQKGTYVHKAMELFDFKTIDSREKIAEWMECVNREKRIDVDVKKILTVDNICCLTESEIGKRIIRADYTGRLFKERKFVIGVPVSKLLEHNESETVHDQLIVVQGIIDLYFEENDNIILVDYKTDSVKEGMEIQLVRRYRTQMQYYKDTLEQLLGKTVSETYIYSFALNKAIPVF